MAEQLNGMDGTEYGVYDYEEWHPPTEAELKVIEAKRERQDKISKLMGDYLIKGFKMLGSTCGVCGTILLRTKQGVDYCVACSELDSDATKDDPALSDVAAQRQAQESHLKQAAVPSEAGDSLVQSRPASALASTFNCDGSGSTSNPGKKGSSKKTVSSDSSVESRLASALASNSNCDGSTSNPGKNEVSEKTASTCPKTTGATLFSPTDGLKEQLEEAAETVVGKLEWATILLQQTQDIDTCIRLCNLIKTCADTIHSLRAVLQ